MTNRTRIPGKTPGIRYACQLVCALFVWAVLGSGSASAELTIRITEGADAAIPVAVVPFAESGGIPSGDKVSSIVQDDLTMSGEFNTLAPEKMLSLPSQRSEV